MFNRGKEMVKDVIAVIHVCIEKSYVIFITNCIERGLVWWKKTQFDGPGYDERLHGTGLTTLVQQRKRGETW